MTTRSKIYLATLIGILYLGLFYVAFDFADRTSKKVLDVQLNYDKLIKTKGE